MSSNYVPGVRLKDHSCTSGAPEAKTFQDLFSRMRVSQVIMNKNIVTVKDTDTLDVAFKTLIDRRVLSAPVWSRSRRRYLGLIEVLDVVRFIVEHFEADLLKADNVSHFLSVSDRFKSMSVKQICAQSDHDPWYPVEADAPVRRLFELFCRGNIHRLPIVEDEAELELFSMASQTDAIALLAVHSSHAVMQSLMQRGLREGKIGTWGKVHSVLTTDTALEAFTLIHRTRVSGVAVVDASGKLVSNISASDLRLIEKDGASLAVLFKSCAEFVALAHAEHVSGSAACRLISLEESSTLADAVLTLDQNHVHRVFVVGKTGEPVAVISQIDVIRVVRDALQ